jgi:hypothetical protein
MFRSSEIMNITFGFGFSCAKSLGEQAKRKNDNLKAEELTTF